MISLHKKRFCLVLALIMVAASLYGCNFLTLPDVSNSTTLSTPTVTIPSIANTTGATGIIGTTGTTVPRPATRPSVVPSPPATTKPAPSGPKPSLPLLTEPTTQPPTEPSTTERPTTAPPTTSPAGPCVPGLEIPRIDVKNAFIFDTRSMEFLYASKEISTAVYPASTTKLFTTYVALLYLDIAETVTIGSELNYVAADASIAGFAKGDVVTVQNLVYGAMLPSGCDASYVLAAAAGRVLLENPDASAKNAIKAFVKECNRIGQSMGMENTNFANPDGYHKSSHYISLQAMAIIGFLALENEHIANAAATDKVQITYTNAQGESCSRTLQNTNKLIHTNSRYYNAQAVGLKTGTTGAAGACLLAAYRVAGGYILVGIFGDSSNNGRFTDANKLFKAYCSSQICQ